MYTVNITFKVPHDLYGEWIEWMQKEWQPKASESCAASGFQLLKLLGHDDEHGATVVFQMHLPSRALLNSYHEVREGALQQLMKDKWGNNILSFQTVLEQITA